ncbi:PAS domain S-box protein [Candidatus Hodarchaeum mangrovi]
MKIKEIENRKDIPDDIKVLISEWNNKISSHQEMIQSLQYYKSRNKILETAFSSSLNAIYIHNLDGKGFNYINSAFAKMWGFEAEDQTKYIDPNNLWADPIEAKKIMEELRKEEQWKGELIAKHRNGSHFHVFGSAHIIQGEDNSRYMVGSFIDVSSRKKISEMLQESELKYRTLVENLNEGVLLQNLDGKYNFANPKMAALLGYEIHEIIGMHWESIVPEHEIPNVKNQRDERLQGKSSVYETFLLRKNGTSFPVIVSANPLFDENGQVKAILAVFTDITTQKNVEKELREKQNLLTRVKLEEERYQAMLSHFTRNNLQKIIYQLDYIKSKYQREGLFKLESIERIIEISIQAARVIELVNRIFEVLQSTFEPPSKKISLMNLFISLFQDLNIPEEYVVVKEGSLAFSLRLDNYFKEALHEIVSFIIQVDKFILLETETSNQYFTLIISDQSSPPIQKEARLRLEGRVQDDWEYQGHYIGVSLASVILQYYGGFLQIKPLEPSGNRFLISLPVSLLE